MAKCIVMLSGGLDSVMSTHILKSQGLDVLALHFVLPFVSGLGLKHEQIHFYADSLGVPLRIIEEGEEYIVMMKDPAYGFGKNANPCIDCRVHRLRTAKKIMEEEGASCVVTGEVIGQRPMSQRLETMNVIEKRSGLVGFLLRPLCAKLLSPTVAEMQGVVDREQLMGITGRNRKPQLEYAAKYHLKHSAPAGGCTLTSLGTTARFLDLAKHMPDFTLKDFKLLGWGRHFRLSSSTKLIVARDDPENGILEKLVGEEDFLLEVVNISGPYGILRGPDAGSYLEKAASIVAHYSKARKMETAPVSALRNGVRQVVTINPATGADVVPIKE